MKSLPTFEPMNKKQSVVFRLSGVLVAVFCLVTMPLQGFATDNKSTTGKPVKTNLGAAGTAQTIYWEAKP